MFRALGSGIAVLILGLSVQAQGTKKTEGLVVEGKITKDDLADKFHAGNQFGRVKAHKYKMIAGKRYTIEATSFQFNFYLRLEDPSGKQIEEVVNSNPAKMSYTAIRTGTYSVVLTTIGTVQGTYKLSVKGPPPPSAVPKTEQPLRVSGEFTGKEPVDPARAGCFSKTIPYHMTAGRSYTIDMTKGTLNDPYLRLLDDTGSQVAFDDDSGGGRNARIVYTAMRSGTYQVVATTCSAGDMGTYQLSASPGSVPGVMPPQERHFGPITIAWQPLTSSSGGGNNDMHGYLEYRFTVSNTSKESHRVTLLMPRFRYSGMRGYFLRSMKATVDVGPGLSVPVSLYQPDLACPSSNDAEVIIDGKSEQEGIGGWMSGNRHGGGYGPYGSKSSGMNPARYILTLTELAPDLEKNIFKSSVPKPGAKPLPPPAGGSFGSTGGTYKGQWYNHFLIHRFIKAAGTERDWTRDWLGYSSYDGVALPGYRMQEMPPEALRALWNYVECGGSLLIVGPGKIPESWQQASASVPGFTAYYPGFGQCLVSDSDVGTWEPEEWRAVTGMWETSYKASQRLLTPTDANRRFPIVDKLTIPVRELFMIMLLFAILIGPVNIYLLTRKKRRLWLLWTVPVFSALTCLAIFAFMLVSEGWQPQVRLAGITVLDENSQRATSLGWLGIYSPLTPGDGLHFSREIELTPQLRMDLYRYESSPRTINWSLDQHLDSGWVSARVPSHFVFRSSEKRLERVLIERDNVGAIHIVNSLKAPMRSFWLADADGTIHAATDVAPGSKAAMKSQSAKAQGTDAALRQVFQKDWDIVGKDIEANPAAYLQPGRYIAVLEATPFFQEGLGNARHRNSASVVYGILKK